MQVHVELVRLGATGDVLRWSRSAVPLAADDAPDVAALAVAGPLPAGAGLHSTSWRHEDGAIVLTYALFPAPDADASWTALAEHVVTGPDAAHPAPEHVEGAHVAAHAVRHLSDLATGRDPHLTRCAEAEPGPWALLVAHGRTVHVHLPATAHP